MPVATLVIGLPGAGKTTYLEDLIRAGVPAFDDFMKGATHNRIAACRYLPQIERHLVQGRDVALADIQLTNPDFRSHLINHLRSVAPTVEIQCIFFENDPVRCLANSARRINQEIETYERIQRITTEFSANYSIPPDAKVIPIAGGKR